MNLNNKSFWSIIIFLFILIGILFYNLLSGSLECKNSPLVYGVKEAEKKSGQEVSCSCYVGQSPKALVITSKGIQEAMQTNKYNYGLEDTMEEKIPLYYKLGEEGIVYQRDGEDNFTRLGVMKSG